MSTAEVDNCLEISAGLAFMLRPAERNGSESEMHYLIKVSHIGAMRFHHHKSGGGWNLING